MFAILLSVLAVSADIEPYALKQPPRFIRVTLEGDQLVYSTTVTEAVPVRKTIEVENNGKKEKREVTEYMTVMKQVKQAINVKTAGVTAGGKKLDLAALKKRLGDKPQVVIVSGDGKPVDEAYLKLLDKDAIVIVPEAMKDKEK